MINNNIVECFACRGCTKKQEFLKDVKAIGSTKDITYVIKECPERYLLKPLDPYFSGLRDFINSSDFTQSFVPKFGKSEFEAYIAEELRKVILITHDLTDLFNTSIICENVLLTSKEVSSELLTRLNHLNTDLKTYTYELDYEMLRKLVH